MNAAVTQSVHWNPVPLHPDHYKPMRVDDPDNPGQQKWDQESERMFGIKRHITMNFVDHDSDGNLIGFIPFLSWGSTDVGGIYKETITGVIKDTDTLYIEGVLMLHKVSSIASLEVP